MGGNFGSYDAGRQSINIPFGETGKTGCQFWSTYLGMYPLALPSSVLCFVFCVYCYLVRASQASLVDHLSTMKMACAGRSKYHHGYKYQHILDMV